MTNVQCRLCSSGSSLISLFNGKNRKNREYIRKLIDLTTGIKFHQNDGCVCYPCTIQIYNFYIFRTRSIENNRRLEVLCRGETSSSNQLGILELDAIDLPEIEELANILAPWLIFKQKYGDSTSDGNGNQKTDMINDGFVNVSNNDNHTSETVVNCNSVEYFQKETQCELSSTEVYTQTSNLGRKSKKTQCDLITSNQNATRVKRIQCELLKGKKRTPIIETGDSTTQTDDVDHLVHYDNENDPHIECKDDLGESFINVKSESPSARSLSPPPSSPVHVSVDYSGKTDQLVSPNIKYTSPTSPSNLLTVMNKSRCVIICPNCDQSLYSKSQYKIHIRSHMVCNFCKKKFKSIKRTKLHIQNDCQVQKLTDTVPVVTLVRLECLKDVRKKYPNCLEDLEKPHYEVHKSFRMRSRSTSTTESFHSSCDACKSCFSLLRQLSLGVDKSIQTNLLLDTDFIKSQFIKRKFKEDLDDPPAKRPKILV